MISLVISLILNNTYSKYNKKDIDLGNTPLDIYTLCSGIREFFCLSYAIRKTNLLYLYFHSDLILIKLDGKKLRFLGSDERSQSILLLKALNKAKTLLNERWERSTPGIYVMKLLKTLNIDQFIKKISFERIFLINQSENTDFQHNSKNYEYKSQDLFIIINDLCVDIIRELFENLDSSIKIKKINFSEIKSLENKIIYINYLIDQQKQ